MSLAPVSDHGTSLKYIDSGPVDGNTYTTLVCVHGLTYHSQNFRRLFTLAPAHNMRIVALNRRDYAGSTPYSPEELDALNNGDAKGYTAFLRARGLEIARFLAWFVETQHIPQASEDAKSGGLALLGWSAGNMTTLAFLGHINSFPSELVQVLEPYLRTFFIYDVAYSSLGFDAPADGAGYDPLTDPQISKHARGIKFGIWISSFFKHPDPSLRSLSGLQLGIPTSPYRPATLETMSFDELISVIDPAPEKRSEPGFKAEAMRGPLYDQMRVALFDVGPVHVLPQVKVRMVHCAESPWNIYWGVWEMEKEIELWKGKNMQGRPLEIINVHDANHFLHWEDPTLALEVFTAGIRS